MTSARRLLGRVPSLLDGPSPPGGQDLLAPEREQESRRRRGLRRLSPMRVFDHPRVALVFLVLFVGGGAIFLLLAGGESNDLARSGRPLAVDRATLVRLPVEGSLAASRYGRPVGLSGAGMPVVQTAAGEVRELTDLELEFAREIPGTGFVGERYLLYQPGSVWNPGPRGLGQWWRTETQVESVSRLLYFGREDWLLHQERRLAEATELLADALAPLPLLTSDRWEPGAVRRIYQNARAVRDLYAEATRNRTWAGIPSRWVCDPAFEASLTMGVTLGCPPGWIQQDLMHLWSLAGSLAESLLIVGEAGLSVDALPAGDRLPSGRVHDLRGRALGVVEETGVFAEALDDFSSRMLREGFIFETSLAPELEFPPE